MSTKMITTCDRCGKKTEEVSWTPDKWGAIQLEVYREQPGPNGERYERTGMHVCPDCIGALKAFLNGGK